MENGWKGCRTLSFLVILRTEHITRDIETSRTEERGIDGEEGTEPFTDTDDEVPSAILTLSLPEHVEYDEKKYGHQSYNQ